jgi:hypothetical protein
MSGTRHSSKTATHKGSRPIALMIVQMSAATTRTKLMLMGYSL